MNDHIAKPMAKETLAEIASAWIGDRSESRKDALDTSPATAQHTDLAVFDPTPLMDVVGGDSDAFDTLIETFTSHNAGKVAQIRDAAVKGDNYAVRQIAHAIRGSAATFHVERLHAVSAHLEAACVSAAFDRVPELVERIESEWDLFRAHRTKVNR